MDPKIFCQSCTMPIDDPSDRGTEKDGSKSIEYCKYCYQSGGFTDSNITFDQMRSIVTTQMNKMNLSPEIIQKSLDSLSHLKRWQEQKV